MIATKSAAILDTSSGWMNGRKSFPTMSDSTQANSSHNAGFTCRARPLPSKTALPNGALSELI
jgi:hypothetical protein